MATAWKSALTMKPMKNVALAGSNTNIQQIWKKRFSEKIEFQMHKLLNKVEKENNLKDKHDTEKDRDRLRLTRLKNVQTGQQERKSIEHNKAIAIAKKKSGKYDKDGKKINASHCSSEGVSPEVS